MKPLNIQDQELPTPPEGVISSGNISIPCEYLSPSALADYLGVPLNTIRGWRKRALLPPAFKMGKTIRWSRKGIDDWIKEHREAGAYGHPGALQWRGRALQRQQK